jgi:hypothetical protein
MADNPPRASPVRALSWAATAAALALQSNAAPREVDRTALQAKLTEQGVWLG